MTAEDNRLFGEAVVYRYRAGVAWRDLPERFGDEVQRGADADIAYAMIDSTILRAHQHSAGARTGWAGRTGRTKPSVDPAVA